MEIDSYYVLCPYCQAECGDPESFDDYNIWDEEHIDFECEDCNKKFTAQRCVTVDYRSEANCELNDEKHEQGEYHCKKCDIYNSVMEESTHNKSANKGGKDE